MGLRNKRHKHVTYAQHYLYPRPVKVLLILTY